MTVLNIGLPKGIYYLEISYYNGEYDDIPYSFDLSLTESDFYEKEVNNTTKNANHIELNQKYQGILSDYTDKDYYKFEVENPGKLNLSISNILSTELGASIYDQNGNKLESIRTIRSSTAKENAELNIGLPKGIYYLEIAYGNGEYNDTPYSFDLSLTESDFYEKEVNNTTKNANHIELNQKYQGFLGDYTDKDYYKFEVENPGKLNLSISNILSTELGASIYDQNGNKLESIRTTRSSTAKENAVLNIGLPKGIYYLEIAYANGEYNDTPYSFTLESELFNDVSFTDLGSHSWAEDAIYYLNERGVISGYGNGLFGPGDNITRGQAALMLVRELYPNEKSNTELPFSDVDKNEYYYNAIAVALDHGIFDGNPDGTFKPNDPISRAATAKILALAFGLTGENANFSDMYDVDWATEYIKALASNNIVNGYGDNTFRPNNAISRAEFSVSLARILDDKFKSKARYGSKLFRGKISSKCIKNI